MIKILAKNSKYIGKTKRSSSVCLENMLQTEAVQFANTPLIVITANNTAQSEMWLKTELALSLAFLLIAHINFVKFYQYKKPCIL